MAGVARSLGYIGVIVERRLEAIRAKIQGESMGVVLNPSIFKSETLHLEIQELPGEIVLGSAHDRGGHVGLAIGRHSDIQLRLFDHQHRDIDLLLERGDNFQADLNLFGSKKWRRGRRLLAMQNEGRNFGGECAPVVIEAADLDASAAGVFDHGHDSLANLILKPVAAHDRERGDDGHNQQRHDARQANQDEPDAPAHLSASS